MIRYWLIPGDPVGKARARVFRNKYTGCVHAVTPKKTANWESYASDFIACTWSENPLDEPVFLDIVCVFSRPKRLLRKCSPPGRIPHDVKPDWDNVGKIVSDALTRAGVLRDDARVSKACVEKVYAALDELPKVEVRVDELSNHMARGMR